MSKLPPKLVLTASQRETMAAIRQQVERDRPEIVAEGRRVAQANDETSVQLRGAFTLLKAVRKSTGVTLADLAGKTGISKGALSRLENDPSSNVTLTTLHRVASALGCELQISVTSVNEKRATPRLAKPRGTMTKAEQIKRFGIESR